MTKNLRPPTIAALSFDCAHCGAFAHQTWFSAAATSIGTDDRLPSRWTHEGYEKIKRDTSLKEEDRNRIIKYIEQLAAGKPFPDKNSNSGHTTLHNVYFSHCVSCNNFSVWVAERVVYPPTVLMVAANDDMPPEIAADFNEAREIVEVSPRGAAALLRLAIQKLCIHLGEAGRKIDDDIASLVKKGLNPILQRSLDVVRVIGNEAVHPGSIDLRDDRPTANALFRLVNGIVDQMISHPKAVNEMYEALPPSKLKGIENRDKLKQ
jgi:hypothetical protein